MQQQTATSEVLKVISSSPGELKPVFDAMLENAVRLCNAKFGFMWRYQNGKFHPAGFFNVPKKLIDFFLDRGAFAPTGTPLERMLLTKQTIHAADLSTEAVPPPAAKLGGARSYIAVPMLKDDELVGSIIIYRQEVRPFTNKQVELVRISPLRLSSPSRTRACSTNCASAPAI